MREMDEVILNPYSEPPVQHQDKDDDRNDDNFEVENKPNDRKYEVSLLQSCCRLCWVPKNSFAWADMSIRPVFFKQ